MKDRRRKKRKKGHKRHKNGEKARRTVNEMENGIAGKGGNEKTRALCNVTDLTGN